MIKASDVIRKIVCNSDVGDPPWKRQTAACVVVGVGLIALAPSIWTWIGSLLH